MIIKSAKLLSHLTSRTKLLRQAGEVSQQVLLEAEKYTEDEDFCKKVLDLHNLLSELADETTAEVDLMARNVHEALADKEGRAASKKAGNSGSD